jgi:hypothetical protein
MAKLSYLELTNRVLKRISQSVITDVASAEGKSLIVTELINEAQNELWTQANWYSLYKTRKWSTVTYTAATITFNDANPDTITDSASGFGDFQDGQQILVSGSSSNDGTYTVSTAVAGTLTLQSADTLTAEAAGESVTIIPITYPVPSDWGRAIDLVNVTDNMVLTEDVMRAFDEDDPDMDSTGTVTHFALNGSFYRLHQIPASATVIRERYWKLPTALAANADTSDLPIECENCIIQFAMVGINEYLNKFENADRARTVFGHMLRSAVAMNSKMIDQLIRFRGADVGVGIHPPRLPSSYGRVGRY